KFEQGAKVYPVIPDSLKCYENPYELTKVLQSDDEMSHLVCASECVRRDLYGKKFKYFAIANGDRCFCESELPPAEYKTKNKNEKCSYRCPRNDKQSCGGPGELCILNWKSRILLRNQANKKKQGAKVYPAIPNSPFACYLYVEYLSGPKLKSDNMSHLVCATECVRRDLYFGFKYFAIANGDRCFCESELPPAKYKKELNETCSYRCPRNDKQSCGGPEGIVYFKLETTNTPPESGKYEKKQGAKIYPAIPNSPIQCYRYYDGTGKVRLTSNEMSHLICATECVKRDLYGRFKYFAIANGDRCFCESELPPVTNKAQLNETCSYRCQQNDKQSCGSPLGIVYFKLEITNTPPESGKYEKKQGAKIYPAIPNSPTQCYQYDGKGIVRLTSNEMSHLICATECVKRDLYGRFKYFAIANGDRCFCESELPPASEKIPVNEHCSFRCPRNFKQICGSGTGIVYFKLETTNTPHKSGKCSVTSPPVHDLVLT
uniref:WSC domain-containing protein n=1 Tax=Macrostomum lignano TaxID=282301 RepID=A0A1I8GVD0_9PLAT